MEQLYFFWYSDIELKEGLNYQINDEIRRLTMDLEQIVLHRDIF